MDRVFRFLDTIILIGLIVYILLFVWIPVPGIRPYCVDSGSMEPDIREGDLAYVRMCRAEDIRKGDVAAFQTESSRTVLHRVIGVSEDGFITKGDANDTCDFVTATSSSVSGKLWMVLPYGGSCWKIFSSEETAAIISMYVFFRIVLLFYRKLRYTVG